MEEKVNALEAEAESTSQMIGGDSLEGQFKQLEQGSGVDDELSQCGAASCLWICHCVLWLHCLG